MLLFFPRGVLDEILGLIESVSEDFPSYFSKSSPSLQYGNYNQNTPQLKPPGENKGHNHLSQPICNYCKQSGHIVSNCPVLKRKREK